MPTIPLTAGNPTQAILAAIPKPNRVKAPFRWYGGKGKLAKWIVPHIPESKVYVEPYCGAASIFWHKRPAPVEVLNDLHSEIINLYRVLQDQNKFRQLQHRLAWTPYSREEFRLALDESAEVSEVDRAWSFFVMQNQGFGGKANSEGDWGRGFVESRGVSYVASRYNGQIKLLQDWHGRLRGVQLDNCDALQCIRYWDSEDTTFYVDPPYVMDTRTCKRKAYKHECTDDHHRQLVDLLLTIKGQAVLSGYHSEIYRPLLQAGWEREEKQTASHAAGRVRGSGLQGKGAAMAKVPRTEALWIKRHITKHTGDYVLFGSNGAE